MSKENEYKELFYAEALDSHAELDRLFMDLETDVQNQRVIAAIFRITHTLKGNAMGLGFDAIAELSHVLEDFFNAIKIGQVRLDKDLFKNLFRANDVLGQLIAAIKTGQKVAYKGIKAKLKVALRNALQHQEKAPTTATPDTESEPQKAPTEETNHQAVTFSDMIQIPVRKLDKLMNIVGELLIEKDMLLAQSERLGMDTSSMTRLHRITADLQYNIMDIRLVPVSFLFDKFHRIVRDAAQLEQKEVQLILEGTSSQIDRNVLKIISDSLIHLVRNAVSHGIESPKERLNSGKNKQGTIKLTASNEKDAVRITIQDDGAGINTEKIRKKLQEKGLVSAENAQKLKEQELLMFIFESGFSSADKITAVSGRGVGLDVVRSAIENIGGKIDIETTTGKGTCFILTLPLSVAVKDALLFELDQQEFAIPLAYTKAVFSTKKEHTYLFQNQLFMSYQDMTLPIVFLRDLCQLSDLEDINNNKHLLKTYTSLSSTSSLQIIIIHHNNRYIGLVVDKLLQQKEIVEKQIPAPLSNVEAFSGATILGEGQICLVFNIPVLLKYLFKDQFMKNSNRLN